jgi:hypothetical protein
MVSVLPVPVGKTTVAGSKSEPTEKWAAIAWSAPICGRRSPGASVSKSSTAKVNLLRQDARTFSGVSAQFSRTPRRSHFSSRGAETSPY